MNRKEDGKRCWFVSSNSVFPVHVREIKKFKTNYSLVSKYTILCFLLGSFPASEFYMPMFQNTLSVPSS